MARTAKSLFLITLLVFVAVLGSISQFVRVTGVNSAGDIVVPDDYATIQQAVNAAQPGDTILIRNGTYYESLTISKPLTLLGESRYGAIINGTDAPTVISVAADNVTIKDLKLEARSWKSNQIVLMDKCRYCNVLDNWFYTDGCCVQLLNSQDNVVAYNLLGGEYQWCCIILVESSNNMIIGNIQWTGSDQAFVINGGHDNFVASNTFCLHQMAEGTKLESSLNNVLVNNTVLGSRGTGAISLYNSNGTQAWHNNITQFLGNDGRIRLANSHNNTWDAGYPSGGNSWWWLNVTDQFSGSYQNETGRDGIIDTPFIIDSDNVDNYPLVSRYQGSQHEVGVRASVLLSKTAVPKGSVVGVRVKTVNYGDQEENCTVKVSANGIPLTVRNLTLDSQSVQVFTTFWNTSEVETGNYELTASADPLPGENDTLDNIHSFATITVTITGDVDGNGWVDMRDIGKCCLSFGSSWWLPSWNANCDFNNDEKIDMRDIGLCCGNFGKKCPIPQQPAFL